MNLNPLTMSAAELEESIIRYCAYAYNASSASEKARYERLIALYKAALDIARNREQ